MFDNHMCFDGEAGRNTMSRLVELISGRAMETFEHTFPDAQGKDGADAFQAAIGALAGHFREENNQIIEQERRLMEGIRSKLDDQYSAIRDQCADAIREGRPASEVRTNIVSLFDGMLRRVLFSDGKFNNVASTFHQNYLTGLKARTEADFPDGLKPVTSWLHGTYEARGNQRLNQQA